MSHQIDLFTGKPELISDQGKVKALDELFELSANYRKSGEFLSLLQFINKFPDLSPYNAFLVHLQDNGSRKVLPAKKWINYGRKVKPHSRPFIILVPFGPVDLVYDIVDTEPLPGYYEDVPEQLQFPFLTKGDIQTSVYERIVRNALLDKIECTEYSMQTGNAGYATFKSNDIFKVAVNGSFRINEKFSTLVHELGHIFCGHLGRIKGNWWQERYTDSKDVREVEAESISYLVCARMGLVTTSPEYLSGYIREGKDLPNISIESILTVSNYIESMAKPGFKSKSKI